jgi:hypothetical protein
MAQRASDQNSQHFGRRIELLPPNRRSAVRVRSNPQVKQMERTDAAESPQEDCGESTGTSPGLCGRTSYSATICWVTRFRVIPSLCRKSLLQLLFNQEHNDRFLPILALRDSLGESAQRENSTHQPHSELNNCSCCHK